MGVRLTYRLHARPRLSGRRAARRLESELTDTGRVRAARVTLAGREVTVACVVKGVDDIEAAYVALAYVDSSVAQISELDLGDLAYKNVALHLPPTMGDYAA